MIKKLKYVAVGEAMKLILLILLILYSIVV
jgi:hypothetical protein